MANGTSLIKMANSYLTNGFIDAYSFYKGFARVKRTNGEWAKIDKYGNLIKN